MNITTVITLIYDVIIWIYHSEDRYAMSMMTNICGKENKHVPTKLYSSLPTR